MRPLKLLIPVDGTETSLEAVRHALALIRAGLKAECVLANVQDDPSLYELIVAHDMDVIEAVSGEAGTRLLQPAIDLLQQAGVDFETEVARGDAARTLIEIVETEGCDAVIIGAARVGTLRTMLMGSVSRVLLRDCPVPVTVVHPPHPSPSARPDVLDEAGTADVTDPTSAAPGAP